MKTAVKYKRGIHALSIIIPVLNEEHYLPKLLTSLINQNFNGDLQVIVVDGHSEDRTVELAKQFKNKLADLEIIMTDKGIGHQRNEGAKKAKYEHLLFLDADTMLPKNMLNTLAKKINPQEQIIDWMIHLPDKFHLLDYLWSIPVLLFIISVQKISPALVGSFILTTKTNHQKIGGFKEGSILAEDVDYGARSAKNGAKHHVHIYPFIYASTRRAEKTGRVKLMFTWLFWYLHVLRKGEPIHQSKTISYSFGEHSRQK